MAQYIYSPHYHVDIGLHVFPTAKYELIRERLIDQDGALAEDFLEPEQASAEEILSVHTQDYYLKCRDNLLSSLDQMRLELPWSPELFDAATRCVRGSIDAARLALNHGVGLHLGGGFHHAYPDHGEGFCVFNDHSCAIRQLQAEGAIEKALIADCDLHQGNGTAAVFADDPTVATFSIHQDHIYPMDRPPSTIDIGLMPGTNDKAYMQELERWLLPLFDSHAPDFVVFVGGADPYCEDQLGSLALTREGLSMRDALVADACKERGLPLLVVLAGGYAHDFEDTIAIHLETIRQTRCLWDSAGADGIE